MANSATPVQHVDVNGDTYTFKTSTTFKNTELIFTIGVEFDEETMDGRKVKVSVWMMCELCEWKAYRCPVYTLPPIQSIVTRESDTKLVHVQKPINENEAGGTITREIIDDVYVMVRKFILDIEHTKNDSVLLRFQTLETKGVKAVRKYKKQ